MNGNEATADRAVAGAREYRRTRLDGASFVPLPADRTRTEAVGVHSVYRFRIDHGVTSAVQLLAKRMDSSPFVVLFAAFNLMVRQHTGATDMVLPAITSGRTDPPFVETVDPFCNVVPLRTNLAACHTFRNVVTHTRATCVEALSHEVPFGVVLGQAPHVLPDPDTSAVADGVLWALDLRPDGDIVGSIRFNSNDVDEASLAEMAEGYVDLLRFAVAAPDDSIDDLLQ